MSEAKLETLAWEGVVAQDTYQVVGEDDSYGETSWSVRCWQERGDGSFEWVTVSAGEDADAPEVAAVAAQVAGELAQAEARVRDLVEDLESEREACEIAARKWTELEEHLERLRPVVAAALDIEAEGPRSEFDGRSATGIDWFDEMVDALVSEVDDHLTPEDRLWAEGD